MPTVELDIETAEWAEPLLAPARYKGAKGGRSRGGSHFFAESAVEAMVTDPALRFVCVREVQRSLKYSAKSLVEAKIRKLGVSDLFQVLEREIRRVGGTGIMIFEGMQDHTADSLKSLEGFGRAWVEEAQSLSKRSLSLLTPTIRMPGSELWFSWNPNQPDDPIEKLFRGFAGADYPESTGKAVGDDYVVIHATYLDNPFEEENAEAIKEAERLKLSDPDAYAHIWLGEYDTKSDAKVLAGKWRVDEFEPQPHWDGPYQGSDFGFAVDPTTLVRVWIGEGRLWVERESYSVRLEIDETASYWQRDVPGFADYVVRGDSARPDTISYLRNHGVPKIEAAIKGQGSVEAGIEFLRNFEEIVIHPRCPHAIEEARLYSYKVDRLTGDVLPKIEDAHNHIWDAARYALSPLIRRGHRLVFR